MKKNPAEKIYVPIEARPKCEIEGCCNAAQLVSNSKVTGLPFWRKSNGKYICVVHHGRLVAEKRGYKNIEQVIAANAGFSSVSEYLNHRARENGFETHYEYLDSLARKAGFDGVRGRMEYRARERGFDSLTEYNNSKHRYRKNRKDYCENNNGMGIWIDPDTGQRRFLHDAGVVCTATITHVAMLSVDHINGENTDDSEGNHQTLCHNCHKVKSILSKDHWTAEKKRAYLQKKLMESASALVFG